MFEDILEKMQSSEHSAAVDLLFGNLGGWSLDREVIEFILQKKFNKILMLGSGPGSIVLAKAGVEVWAIEENPQYILEGVPKNHHYIYCPLKNYKHNEHQEYKWYHVSQLKLPKYYDLIVVDGPAYSENRFGFYQHFNLFKKDVDIIMDDINRTVEYKTLLLIGKRLGREFTVKNLYQRKQFGYMAYEKQHSI